MLTSWVSGVGASSLLQENKTATPASIVISVFN
jgi:hypothetical protein